VQVSRTPLVNVDKNPSLKYYGEPVTVKPLTGLYFEWRKLPLTFGMACQDVVADFGSPNSIYLKKDHKMLIHSSATNISGTQHFSNLSSSSSFSVCFFYFLFFIFKFIHLFLLVADSLDYFYNYFDLGFDLLFDGETHQVKRFIMHSNIPGQLDFNSYRKCNFRLTVIPSPLKSQPQPSTSLASQPRFEPVQPAQEKPGKGGKGMARQGKRKGANGVNGAAAAPNGATNGTSANGHHGNGLHGKSWGNNGHHHEDDDDGEEGMNGHPSHLQPLESLPALTTEAAVITCDTNWTTIMKILGQPMGDPVIASRGSSLNPYGATRYFGYPNYVFEVTETRHVVSLTLFID